jgi:hypothetical protein
LNTNGAGKVTGLAFGFLDELLFALVGELLELVFAPQGSGKVGLWFYIYQMNWTVDACVASAGSFVVLTFAPFRVGAPPGIKTAIFTFHDVAKERHDPALEFFLV